jgi:hypothetical protein
VSDNEANEIEIRNRYILNIQYFLAGKYFWREKIFGGKRFLAGKDFWRENNWCLSKNSAGKNQSDLISCRTVENRGRLVSIFGCGLLQKLRHRCQKNFLMRSVCPFQLERKTAPRVFGFVPFFVRLYVCNLVSA